MKIIIEHERGEGGTTLAQVLYKFLTMLPYNLEWEELPKVAREQHLKEVRDISAIGHKNLYEIKDVTIETKCKRREVAITTENIVSGRILSKAEHFFLSAGTSKATLKIPQVDLHRLVSELKSPLDEGDMIRTPYGDLIIQIDNKLSVVS